jgi:hypothetical protein
MMHRLSIEPIVSAEWEESRIIFGLFYILAATNKKKWSAGWAVPKATLHFRRY